MGTSKIIQIDRFIVDNREFLFVEIKLAYVF